MNYKITNFINFPFNPLNLLTIEEKCYFNSISSHFYWLDNTCVKTQEEITNHYLTINNYISIFKERNIQHILSGDIEVFFDYNYNRLLKWKEVYSSIFNNRKEKLEQTLKYLQEQARQIDEFRANKDYKNADILKLKLISEGYKVNISKTGTTLLIDNKKESDVLGLVEDTPIEEHYNEKNIRIHDNEIII